MKRGLGICWALLLCLLASACASAAAGRPIDLLPNSIADAFGPVAARRLLDGRSDVSNDVIQQQNRTGAAAGTSAAQSSPSDSSTGAIKVVTKLPSTADPGLAVRVTKPSSDASSKPALVFEISPSASSSRVSDDATAQQQQQESADAVRAQDEKQVQATKPPTNQSAESLQAAPQQQPPTAPAPGALSNSSLAQVAAAASAAVTAAVPQLTGPSTSIPPSTELVTHSSGSSNSGMFAAGPGGFWYVPERRGSNVPLGMPLAATPGLQVSRWVMCAWGVSNFSSPQMLSEDVMHEVQNMINNFTTMAPGQVQLAASANVTLSFSLNDLPLETAANETLLTAALTASASKWAGGYDPAFISVFYSRPDYGVPTAQFQAAGNQSIVQRSQEAMVITPHNSSSNGSSSNGGHSGNRRMLRQKDSSGWAPSAAAGDDGSTTSRRVWVSYTRMTPLNATDLQRRVSEACGVDEMSSGQVMDGSPCADQLNVQLLMKGADLSKGGVGLEVIEDPMVSLAIRLAVGVTEAQAAADVDHLLAAWLAQPRNIRSAIAISGVPDPIGPDAIIKWLLTPEIWVSPVAAAVRPHPLSNPANAVGVALGCAGFVGLCGGLLGVWLLRRSRQQRAALEGDKHDTGSTASSRRRRRRHGKRRYLLPEAPPPPDPEAPSTSAAATAAMASSSGAAATAAAAVAGSNDDNDVMSPDQIRPAMRELGDSVTSAVRFEDDDEEEGSPGGGGGGAAEGGAAGTAAATAAAGSLPGGSSRGVSQAQRVLAAREAILAERQGAAAAPTAAAAGPNTISSSTSRDSPFMLAAGFAAAATAAAAGTTAAAADGSGPDRDSQLVVAGDSCDRYDRYDSGGGGHIQLVDLATGGAQPQAAAAGVVAVDDQQQQQQQHQLATPFGAPHIQQRLQQQQQQPAGTTAVRERALSSPRSYELQGRQSGHGQQGAAPVAAHNNSNKGLAAAAAAAGAPAAVAAVDSATSLTPSSQQRKQQKPEQQGSVLSGVASSAVALQPGRRRSLSPFAVSYDFTQLTGAAAAAAGSAVSRVNSGDSCSSAGRPTAGHSGRLPAVAAASAVDHQLHQDISTQQQLPVTSPCQQQQQQIVDDCWGSSCSSSSGVLRGTLSGSQRSFRPSTSSEGSSPTAHTPQAHRGDPQGGCAGGTHIGGCCEGVGVGCGERGCVGVSKHLESSAASYCEVSTPTSEAKTYE